MVPGRRHPSKEIPRWQNPDLPLGGGSGGDIGGVRVGYCSHADYREIDRYAARNFVTIVPEIEGPAHMDDVVRQVAATRPEAFRRPTTQPAFVGFGRCLPNMARNSCVGRR
ncbi:family 20 glycosylhydrolase [Kutzneria sp. CA-103260]|uniref:family 20 glycosylhydrolase n=1 Tax=Kutzneria sp. CA-103260 TaxID=2802641 RepID=UPI001BA5F352